MARYCIETYGCQMNLADSELIAGILAEAGWAAVRAPEDADLVVINTCSVRERAAERVIGHVQSMTALRQKRPALRIIVVGCLPQHLGETLAERLPQVDHFVGPDNYRQLPELLARAAEQERLHLARNRAETYAGLRPIRREGVNAWVSIMRGCDRFCTYCAVPFGRGRERSLPPERIVRMAAGVVADGFVSVTLLGQAVTSYRYEDCDFAQLLERLVRVEGLKKLRFLSPHPGDFTPPLLDAMASSPVIARHLHLPLQSGANAVLANMRRGYTREAYLALVEMARAKLPGLGLTTDIIVGFPGETEEDYQETVALMEQTRFDSAFLFAYSPRERTHAARHLEDDVSRDVKQRRLRQVIDLQEQHSWERFRAIVGETRQVLVEGAAKGSAEALFGRCDDHKAVVVTPRQDRPAAPGEIIRVRMTDTSSHTLRGQQI